MNKKLCKKCNEEKELKFMVKHSQAKDGYLYKCKECEKRERLAKKGKKLKITVVEKTCPVCKSTKSKDEYNKSIRSEDGLQFLCSECYNYHNNINKGKDKNYFRKLRTKVDDEFRKKLQKQKRENARKNHKSVMVSNAKRRALKKGLEFTLTKEDIVIPDICPILKVPFVVGTKEDYSLTPTIDRIDNSRGYTPDNIQIISNKANSMKNSASFKMLKTFAQHIENDIRYSPNNSEEKAIESGDKEPLR